MTRMETPLLENDWYLLLLIDSWSRSRSEKLETNTLSQKRKTQGGSVGRPRATLRSVSEQRAAENFADGTLRQAFGELDFVRHLVRGDLTAQAVTNSLHQFV